MIHAACCSEQMAYKYEYTDTVEVFKNRLVCFILIYFSLVGRSNLVGKNNKFSSFSFSEVTVIHTSI